ncbi:GNAT family N-acetyltransferase [Microbacterium sp. NPDC077663]|uniref:GNAT family N-acetyltransferase n=1 Tax=Microbacterium sp. NPDC077663 TaxID=3364189 RepID=UPI0037C82F5E
MIRTRMATVADAAAIAAIHVASRAAYYGAHLDPADAARDRGPMWRRLVAEDGRVTVVAEDAEPTGFLHVRLGETVELVGLYVLPELFGRGIGSTLYERFDETRAGRPAELEVWDGNAGAKAYYAGRGWRATDRTRDGVAGIPFVTWRLDL